MPSAKHLAAQAKREEERQAARILWEDVDFPDTEEPEPDPKDERGITDPPGIRGKYGWGV